MSFSKCAVVSHSVVSPSVVSPSVVSPSNQKKRTRMELFVENPTFLADAQYFQHNVRKRSVSTEKKMVWSKALYELYMSNVGCQAFPLQAKELSAFICHVCFFFIFFLFFSCCCLLELVFYRYILL